MKVNEKNTVALGQLKLFNVVDICFVDGPLYYLGLILPPVVAEGVEPNNEANQEKGAQAATGDVVDDLQMVTPLLIPLIFFPNPSLFCLPLTFP